MAVVMHATSPSSPASPATAAALHLVSGDVWTIKTKKPWAVASWGAQVAQFLVAATG